MNFLGADRIPNLDGAVLGVKKIKRKLNFFLFLQP
tara:strand:+ start:1687 stop:1791 length:105 start_codon:yes stop_codon:yes gene_type:complete